MCSLQVPRTLRTTVSDKTLGKGSKELEGEQIILEAESTLQSGERGGGKQAATEHSQLTVTKQDEQCSRKQRLEKR